MSTNISIREIGFGLPSDDDTEGPHKELADQMMGLYVGIYGQATMLRMYPNDPALRLGRREFIRVLKNKTTDQIGRGVELLRQNPGSWPKAPGEFARLCVRAPEHTYVQKQLPNKATPDVARRWIAKMKEGLRAKTK